MQLPQEIIKMVQNLKNENEELKKEILKLKEEIQLDEKENRIQTERRIDSNRSVKDNQFENL